MALSIEEFLAGLTPAQRQAIGLHMWAFGAVMASSSIDEVRRAGAVLLVEEWPGFVDADEVKAAPLEDLDALVCRLHDGIREGDDALDELKARAARRVQEQKGIDTEGGR